MLRSSTVVKPDLTIKTSTWRKQTSVVNDWVFVSLPNGLSKCTWTPDGRLFRAHWSRCCVDVVVVMVGSGAVLIRIKVRGASVTGSLGWNILFGDDIVVEETTWSLLVGGTAGTGSVYAGSVLLVGRYVGVYIGLSAGGGWYTKPPVGQYTGSVVSM